MDNSQLKEFSNVHLGKEIHLLFAAVELFATHVEDRTNILNLCAKQIFLNGVIMHSRCLIEFLYSDKPRVSKRNDDVRACDFFVDPLEWEKLRPKKPEHFDELSKRANKEVAHLTRTRTETADMAARWNILSPSRDLLSILQLFIEQADSLKIHPELRNDLDYARGRIESLMA